MAPPVRRLRPARGAAGRSRPQTPRAASTPRPVAPGSAYPAGAFCSNCGLCDTPFIAHVKEACAFLGSGEKWVGVGWGRCARPPARTNLPRLSGMAKAHAMEPAVHGRHRDLTSEHELRYGVTAETFYARARRPVNGAQWTGVVTRIACAALEAGVVDAVACVGGQPDDPLAPLPVLARTPAEVASAAGVKPCLAPTLRLLPAIEALAATGDIKRLLFVGVGCQVQAVRAVQDRLGLDALFVLGTNCADNGPRDGLRAFLEAAVPEPESVAKYEFAQGEPEVEGAPRGRGARAPPPPSRPPTHPDYTVHFGAKPGAEGGPNPDRVPYFSLPSNDLTDVIAPSCLACFDYTNSLADVVVGYMGVPAPLFGELSMRNGFSHVTSRNAAGAALLAAAAPALETKPTQTWGQALVAPLAMATLEADDEARLGRGPDPAPATVGALIARALTWLGPRGLAFGAYSVDYHALRNALFVKRFFPKARAGSHLPPHAVEIYRRYDRNGKMSARLSEAPPDAPRARVREA